MCPPSLLSHYCAKLTVGHTYAALDALVSVDDMGLTNSTCDSAYRAVPCAERAALTLIGDDLILEQILADTCGTSAFLDMSLILFSELLDGGKYRVGSRLTESAERRGLHVVGKAVDEVEVVHSSLSLGYLVKELVELSRTYTAGVALTAGLVNGELKVELGNIDHAVTLVHNDKSARAHHGAQSLQRLVVDRCVDILGRDTAARRAACLSNVKV